MLPSSWRNAWLHSSFCGVCSSKTILERVTKHHHLVCQMMSFILLFFFIILWGSSSTTLTRFANNTRLITMRSQPKCFEVIASLLLFQLSCEGLSYYLAYNPYLHYVDYCWLCVGRWLRYSWGWGCVGVVTIPLLVIMQAMQVVAHSNDKWHQNKVITLHSTLTHSCILGGEDRGVSQPFPGTHQPLLWPQLWQGGQGEAGHSICYQEDKEGGELGITWFMNGPIFV